MNYIDIILIVFVALTALVGLRKGFIRSLFELARYVVGIPLAAFVCSKYAEPIYKNNIRNGVISYVKKKLESSDDLGKTITSFTDMFSNLSSSINGIDIKKTSIQKISTEITDSVLQPIIIVVVNIVLFLLVILAVSVICKLLSELFETKRKGSILDGANKTCGFLFGAGKGALVVLILASAESYIIDFIGTKDSFAKALASSVILKFINNHNPLI